MALNVKSTICRPTSVTTAVRLPLSAQLPRQRNSSVEEISAFGHKVMVEALQGAMGQLRASGRSLGPGDLWIPMAFALNLL